MPFRAVVFDLFGTLVPSAPAESYRAVLARMASHLGLEEEAFARAWQATRPGRLRGEYATLRDNLRAAWTSARSENPSASEPSEDALLRAEAEMLALVRSIVLAPKSEAEEVLAALRGRGLRLGLLSDCHQSSAALFRQSPLAPFFDACVFSCEEGAAKPEPRLFRAVLARLGAEGEESLYVGDGGGGELSAAARAGMFPVLVENPDPDVHLAPGHREGARAVIRDLRELFTLLDSEP